MFLGSNIFHSHIWVTARSNFLQPSIYFLSSFQDNEHHFVRVGTTILSLNYPNTITQVKFRCKKFFLFYFSGMNRTLSRKSCILFP